MEVAYVSEGSKVSLLAGNFYILITDIAVTSYKRALVDRKTSVRYQSFRGFKSLILLHTDVLIGWDPFGVL